MYVCGVNSFRDAYLIIQIDEIVQCFFFIYIKLTQYLQSCYNYLAVSAKRVYSSIEICVDISQ